MPLSVPAADPTELSPEDIDRMLAHWDRAFVEAAGPDTPALQAVEAYLAHASLLMIRLLGRGWAARTFANMGASLALQADIEQAEAERANATGSTNH